MQRQQPVEPLAEQSAAHRRLETISAGNSVAESTKPATAPTPTGWPPAEEKLAKLLTETSHQSLLERSKTIVTITQLENHKVIEN